MNAHSDLFSLAGKTVLITGAAGHLGSAMTSALAAAGAHVLINSRHLDHAQREVDRLLNAGGIADAAVFNVTDPAAIDAFFRDRAGQPLHGLINNAYAGGAGTIESSDTSAYETAYAITVTAAHNLLKAALPSLRQAVQTSGDASVVNIASMYAMVSPDQRVYDSASASNPPYYGAAKAALLQWTRYAACEFGAHGIRVNAISPGPFPAQVVEDSNPRFTEKLRDRVPLGRTGSAEELGGPIVFLTSSASSFVNGANIVVDGGWTCW
ncbi:SDR family NAD(P)-dependent oxidoreductase [Hydrogenophaga sp.]|uniref:SDR family NAD(P)-dependent oxidoreductase n=1 Tax=Hydrogenophaga sp. TaxID=1904254 RepID=UPI0027185D3D|nr:SDR family oxidoreductase [Hydrogenophaga sp.]MDO9438420.1 SDR family oxidoreductase [Hydrogenophaga sp.]